MPSLYLLEWDDRNWCCSAATIRECVNDTLEYYPNIAESDIKFFIKNGNITVHKIGKPLSFKTFVEHLKPKARCINPPAEKKTVVDEWLLSIEEF